MSVDRLLKYYSVCLYHNLLRISARTLYFRLYLLCSLVSVVSFLHCEGLLLHRLPLVGRTSAHFVSSALMVLQSGFLFLNSMLLASPFLLFLFNVYRLKSMKRPFLLLMAYVIMFPLSTPINIATPTLFYLVP